MKNTKKFLGLAFVAAFAMTAAPVVGHAFGHNVVKAAEAVQYKVDSAKYANVKATAIGYNKVELTSLKEEDSEHPETIATIFANDSHKYVWVESKNFTTILEAMKNDSPAPTVLPNAASKKIELSGAAPEGKPFLAIIKNEADNYDNKNLTGIVIEFTRPGKPTSAKLSADKKKITGVDKSMEYVAEDNKKPTDVTKNKANEGYIAVGEQKTEIDVEEPTAGQPKTYLVRTKAVETTFASESQLVLVTNPNKVAFGDLQGLKTGIKDNKLVVGKGELNTLYADPIAKDGDIVYKINGGEEMTLPKKNLLSTGAASPDLTNDVEIPVKDKDKIVFYVKGDTAEGNLVTITIEQETAPTGLSVTTHTEEDGNKGKKKITNFPVSEKYSMKKPGEDAFAEVNEENVFVTTEGTYEVKKAAPTQELGLISGYSDKAKTYKIDSVVASLTVSFNNNSNADVAAVERVSHKVAEEEKKAEEAKKEDPKKEEPKKDDTKTEAPKTEEPKTEAPSEETPVNKTVSSKKAAATVSAEDVALVTGKLTVKVKGATLALPKAVLSEGAVKVSLKAMAPKKDSKDAKALTKNLKKNKLVDKNVYSLSVKTGTKGVNGKFTVTLSTSLKKAPKNLYVMNIANGKLMKAKFSKGKVTFTAGKAGKFVVVSK